MKILLAWLIVAPAVHAQSCDGPLEVTAIRTFRQTTDVRTYQFDQNPRGRTRLEATVESTTLAALRAGGLRRPSRAARAFGRAALDAHEALRLVRLRFEPSSAEVLAHRARPSLHEGIREKFAGDLHSRARLLRAAIADFTDRPTVFHFTFGYDVIAWRDLEEVASLGPTRFATRTWLAEVMRAAGAKGAVMIAGTMPEEARPMAEGPMRYPFEYVRQSGRGAEVLFFRPASP